MSVLIPGTIIPQRVDTIKVRKESTLIYFFQKGAQSDTISRAKHNEFYLLVHDSLKTSVLISVENGRLQRTDNDSILKLDYLPGLKYETFYSKVPLFVSGKNAGFKLEVSALINGTSDIEQNMILIRVIDRREDKTLIENRFYYKAK